MIAVGRLWISLWLALWQLCSSFTYFGDLLRCPHKRIVTITKVYIARNNTQVQFIRFHQKYRLYSCLLFRCEEALRSLYVYSLFARWQQLATNKLITIHSPDGSMTDEQAIIKLGLKTGAGSSCARKVGPSDNSVRY